MWTSIFSAFSTSKPQIIYFIKYSSNINLCGFLKKGFFFYCFDFMFTNSVSLNSQFTA